METQKYRFYIMHMDCIKEKRQITTAEIQRTIDFCKSFRGVGAQEQLVR